MCLEYCVITYYVTCITLLYFITPSPLENIPFILRQLRSYSTNRVLSRYFFSMTFAIVLHPF